MWSCLHHNHLGVKSRRGTVVICSCPACRARNVSRPRGEKAEARVVLQSRWGYPPDGLSHTQRIQHVTIRVDSISVYIWLISIKPHASSILQWYWLAYRGHCKPLKNDWSERSDQDHGCALQNTHEHDPQTPEGVSSKFLFFFLFP